MKIKFFLLISIIFLLPAATKAQILKGRVFDAQTGEVLPYVHIGVPNKNIGLISKDNGTFEIDLMKASMNDSLRFSILGYESESFLLKDLERNFLKVDLKQKTYQLREVVVEAVEIRDLEKFGRHKTTKITTGHSGDGGYGWGEEWGLRIFHDNKSYQIQDVNFHMRFNTVDSALFRINIYTIKDKLPDKSLLNRELYVKSYKNDKWISKNLMEENLVIDEDIIVSFEIVRIWFSKKGENRFFFTHGAEYEKGDSYSRRSSFDNWKMGKGPPVALYITGRVY